METAPPSAFYMTWNKKCDFIIIFMGKMSCFKSIETRREDLAGSDGAPYWAGETPAAAAKVSWGEEFSPSGGN